MFLSGTPAVVNPLLDEHGDAVEVAEDLELDVARPSCVVPRNKGGEPAHDDFHAVDWFAFMLITASFMICVVFLHDVGGIVVHLAPGEGDGVEKERGQH
ncbi:hypothetical protein SCP_1203500 [Sparassis crispa]|uniref:Uncharacterized protein n=1 Tax=Sparassis crispa TaxID=139825 RepID=A0A401H165_9APHY|nr:hypothetical protein SCP_1203500 [Sparassis crispa]GBE88120.1 hypothetical protein SCP_1203500 [Sparassis crispa]